jgi:hypothetical protein
MSYFREDQGVSPNHGRNAAIGLLVCAAAIVACLVVLVVV